LDRCGFLGRGGRRRRELYSRQSGPHLGSVTFDMEESWKGVPEEPVVVHRYGHSPDCGFGFSVGEWYLVYAHRGGKVGDDPLETSICEGTKPLTDAEADLLAALGPAELALPEAAAVEPIATTPDSTGSPV
jgi:hypothetical protein